MPSSSTNNLCCLSARPLSPTDPLPSRPTALPSILALTTLPENHPHALAVPLQPRGTPKNLLRSPSFANKLRGQLRRRATIRSLKAEVYDGDAVLLGSGEVLDRVVGAADGDAVPMRLRVRELSPLNDSLAMSRFQPLSPTATARRVRSTAELRSRQTSGSEDVELRDLAYLNLDLARHQFDGASTATSAAAEQAVDVKDDADADLDYVHIEEQLQEADSASRGEDIGDGPSLALVGLQQPDESNDLAQVDEQLDVLASLQEAAESRDSVDANDRSESHTSFHITKKHISQQLRSMSQLSGPIDDSERLTPEAWTFHRRERSGCFASGPNGDSSRSRHMHHTSESGVNSAHVPESWGRVDQTCDSSSSIYSRPTSPEMPEPYEIPADLDAVADWPLREDTDAPAIDGAAEDDKTLSHPPTTGEEIHITIIEPTLPTSAALNVTLIAGNAEEHLFPLMLDREPSHRSNSSSATKRSRFLERFTPPKKAVRKRRSFFKFLRAGSRRQTRSVSTPVLCSPHLRPFVDGPSDENKLLTVQYELTSMEGNGTRSVSMNNLPSTQPKEAQGAASSPDLRRRPSLAEYERHLSVVGDNRRRPSTKDLARLSQIQEDEQHEPITVKKSFSLHSKVQETDPLMQAALERQLREKAMFRSPSKRSVPYSETSSMSFIVTTWDEPSSAQPQSPERDPLDTGGRKPSHLSPPHTPIDGRSRTSSYIDQPQTGSKKPVILHTPSSISRNSTASRIGSSMDSWTRFPSHSRGDRSASAGLSDKVRTRDFAIHGGMRGADEIDPFVSGKRALTERSAKSSKKSLEMSRSATFGSFVRYYSNLFSSNPEFHGKGRRTSVAVGGRLNHPELEMLPSTPPSATRSQPPMHILEQEQRQLRPGNLAHISEHTEEAIRKLRGASRHEAHSRHAGDPATSPIAFRGDSVFTPVNSENHSDVGPNIKPREATETDESDEYFSATSATNTANEDDHTPGLDGTLESTMDPIKRPTPSKAETWSEAYQSCLVIPPSPAYNNNADEDAKAMPPPSLRPGKGRSTAQDSSNLDPNSTVRRFPSVTVVDDRKGHWRSVSFISVKSGKSGTSLGSFVRESSNDLLKLMEVREREEREKLLQAVM